jgi:FXSXX-COOH protein
VAGENAPSGDAHEWRSDMVDVSGLSLSDLIELADGENSTLALSLRRLADDLTDPGEPIAGFNSAL